MSKDIALNNTLVLGLCLLVVLATGGYYTFYVQPSKIKKLQEIEKVGRMQQAKVSELLVEEARSKELGQRMLNRWYSRYKIIPDSLDNVDVVQTINRLSRSGFHQLSLQYNGTTLKKDYKTHHFTLSGDAYFSALARLIWELENGPQLYRVRDLQLERTEVLEPNRETGIDRKLVMVAFDMGLDVFYGGTEGLSAETVPVIPKDMYPSYPLSVNPFYPLLLEELPPNSDLLLDVDKAELISVTGKRAVFHYLDRLEFVAEGDSVYLGVVQRVDPARGEVVVRMNRGGIIESRVISLDTKTEDMP